ncbi:MAG: hypothetical protein FWG99_09175 [Treponema sp.]|nr:hypothetical protein [Treponema sp.]
MRFKLCIAGFLLGCVMSVVPQENTRLDRDISELLSKNDFEEIVQFILDNGDRRTYCNMYNNNPHYRIEDFSIYLNPISQFINFTRDNLSTLAGEYDEMVIMDQNSTYLYYYIKLSGERIWVYDPYEIKKIDYRNDIIKKYMPKLKGLIR